MNNCNSENHLSNLISTCLGELTTIREYSTGDYDDVDSKRVHRTFTEADGQTIEFRTICGQEVWAKKADWQFLDQHLDYTKPFVFYYESGLVRDTQAGQSILKDAYAIHLIVNK